MARRRQYVRDSKGRFARTPGGSSAKARHRTPSKARRSPAKARRSSPEAVKRRRRRAVVAGSAVVAGAVGIHQARPGSRTRTAARAAQLRRGVVTRHVARARRDHAHMEALRGWVFPDTGRRPFDAKAARREGRRITAKHHRPTRRRVRHR